MIMSIVVIIISYIFRVNRSALFQHCQR